MNPITLFKQLMCCATMAASLSCEAQTYRYNTKFHVLASNFVETIPIEMRDYQIFVTVHVNGRPFRMLLDTGSGQGITYTNSAFPYKRILGKIDSYDANGNMRKTDVVEFQEFRLGNIAIHGYPGTLLDSHVPHKDYDAVLGFDLFNKGLSCKIDPREGVMVLTDIPNYFEREPGFPVKYRLERWSPHIKVSPFPGCTDEARFDTGSRRLYVMSMKSEKQFSMLRADFSSQVEGRAFGHRAIGSFGVERANEVAFLWLDALEWGGFSFQDYHTMTTQGISRVGAEVFDHGAVIIRPKQKLLVFQPYSQSISCMVSNEQMSIAFVPKEGRASVGLIWEGGRHYRCGFRQGDIITGVDEQHIFSFAQFLAYPFIKGQEYRFRLQGADGRERIVVSER